MADFCHTSVRQLVDFAAPECGARLLFWKNERTIINIVVGSFGGAGGAAKVEKSASVFLITYFKSVILKKRNE